MFCFKCGKENDNNAQVCSSCGTALTKEKNTLDIILIVISIFIFLIFICATFYFMIIPAITRKINNDNTFSTASKAYNVMINLFAMERISSGCYNLTAQKVLDIFGQNLNGEWLSYDIFECADGIVYHFYGKGSCKYGTCSIIVDTNGSAGPNKLWTEIDKINDRFEVKIDSNKCKVEIVNPSEYIWNKYINKY